MAVSDRSSRSAGIGLAAFFFLRRRDLARRGRAALPRACTACCCNKYYVDEIYDAAIVQPIEDRSRSRCCGRASTSG